MIRSRRIAVTRGTRLLARGRILWAAPLEEGALPIANGIALLASGTTGTNLAKLLLDMAFG